MLSEVTCMSPTNWLMERCEPNHLDENVLLELAARCESLHQLVSGLMQTCCCS